MKSIYFILALHAFCYPTIAQFGVLDTTFNGNGKVTIDFLGHIDRGIAVALQADKKIVVAGIVESGPLFGVTRIHSDGSLDLNFGVYGKVITPIGTGGAFVSSVALQDDGKIIVAGSAFNGFVLVRYYPDGRIDSTFGDHGILIKELSPFPNCASMAIQSDGKILLAGQMNNTNQDLVMVRYHANGIIDSSFGIFGMTITDIGLTHNGANAIALLPDGKIVAGGYVGGFPVGDFNLLRYHNDGRLDSTFSEDGYVRTSISQFGDYVHGLTIQPDGKIVAVGRTNSGDPNHTDYDFVVMRYDVDGSLDNGFGTEGIMITIFGTEDEVATSVAVQPDGKIVAVGQTTFFQDSDFALARYQSDGTPDTTWGMNGMQTTDFHSGGDFAAGMVIQPDGKIVVVGSALNGLHSDFAIARYLSGLILGVIDFSFVGEVLIYPNPIRENVELEYTLEKDQILSIELYDLAGRLIQVFASRISRTKGTHKESLHLGEDIISGMYLINISNKTGGVSIKIIKE